MLDRVNTPLATEVMA